VRYHLQNISPTEPLIEIFVWYPPEQFSFREYTRNPAIRLMFY
jgi:hypothetical protein